MTNIENLFAYTPGQFEGIDHLLTMGVGAHFAALVFFILMSQFVSPRYRAATALSCIVMVSAGLILNGQAGLWSDTFSFDGRNYVAGNSTFSNGYRYVNWMVTIPCLLTQLLLVLNIRGSRLTSDATKLILAAWGMIITGYIGQLYEVTDLGKLMLWGAISTVFFVYMNYLIGMRIFKQAALMPAPAASNMRKVFWLMMFAWTLYPIAYGIPWFANSATGVVWRQGLFTLADVSSKAVYGLMITFIALQRSAHEGFEPAQKVLDYLRSEKA
ncbi:MAG: bacteriorhodopsin [Bacteroidota bacterium]